MDAPQGGNDHPEPLQIMSNPIRKSMVLLVRGYQIFVSTPLHFLTGPLGGCRFEPTCSQYMMEAILVHGPMKGLGMGIWRVLRCQPWGGQGFDPVPGWDEYVENNPEAADLGRRKRKVKPTIPTP